MQELFELPGIKPDDYSPERARAGFQRYIEDESGDVLLAEAGGALVGLASVFVDIRSIRFGMRCWLEDLIVTSARRSTGVGRQLLEAATDWARERGCTHLELDSGNARKDAHRFYVDQGMEQQGLIFHLPITAE
jgi:GNAT superfamily N-acetyltransferase